MVRENVLIPKPYFQRRAVWTNPDKIAFIETILGGYPFPEIYIAASNVDTTTGDATEILVDGQQRIRTIDEYFRGMSPFKTSRSITKYGDLREDQKREFLNYEVAVRNLGLLDDPTIREIFRRMNSTSYDLNEMERYNAVYLGEFKKLSEELAEYPIIRGAGTFSANDIRRMRDVSYIASIMATMMSTYFNRDDDIEQYLSQYNEVFDAKREVRARFVAAMNYIGELKLPTGSRAWKKADLYTLIVEVDRQLFTEHRRPNATEVSGALTALYQSVDDYRFLVSLDQRVQSYFYATQRNTNDRGQRIARARVVRSILESTAAESFELDIPTLDIPINQPDDELLMPGEDDADSASEQNGQDTGLEE